MANPLDNLLGMDFKGLIKKLKLDDDNFDEWLKDLNLLHRDRKCPYGDHGVSIDKSELYSIAMHAKNLSVHI